MRIHRDRRSDSAGRQRTARRFAVGRRGRLAASTASSGHSCPPFGPLLSSRLLRPITTTSDWEGRPFAQKEWAAPEGTAQFRHRSLLGRKACRSRHSNASTPTWLPTS